MKLNDFEKAVIQTATAIYLAVSKRMIDDGLEYRVDDLMIEAAVDAV